MVKLVSFEFSQNRNVRIQHVPCRRTVPRVQTSTGLTKFSKPFIFHIDDRKLAESVGAMGKFFPQDDSGLTPRRHNVSNGHRVTFLLVWYRGYVNDERIQ